ncbi:hypothetical protein HS7_02880 [Sulfolobales archaeon HS-7]|nr:hypothetical protein HS7_02880 [Sulfolobales archaeon HS-7]
MLTFLVTTVFGASITIRYPSIYLNGVQVAKLRYLFQFENYSCLNVTLGYEKCEVFLIELYNSTSSYFPLRGNSSLSGIYLYFPEERVSTTLPNYNTTNATAVFIPYSYISNLTCYTVGMKGVCVLVIFYAPPAPQSILPTLPSTSSSPQPKPVNYFFILLLIPPIYFIIRGLLKKE